MHDAVVSWPVIVGGASVAESLDLETKHQANHFQSYLYHDAS